ncbi:MAG: NAD(P)-dependent oxidoreductase [Candidatus Omnitrophica bacterium]|nr:NAD(P)-dependent oxidoreductase [Candidatus Omnitrophota bacterium]
MKILIIGAAGFLGNYLLKDLSKGNEAAGADKCEKVKGLAYIDLTEKGLVKEVISRARPEVILLTASITGVDFCEQNQDLAWQVNSEGPKEVAVAAKRQGSSLVFYSSDYVFDGEAGPYTEEDKPNPINCYGRTKLEAEKIIQKELKRYLIIRTCSLYGYQQSGLNFAMQVIRALKENREIRAPYDQFGTPTYVEDISAITARLIKDKRQGIFNVAGPDYLNRTEFAENIAESFGLDKTFVKGTSTAELKQPASRPKKGGLRADKLRVEAGIDTMGLKSGLLQMRRLYG